MNVAWGLDGHGWVCRDCLVPTGWSLARCPVWGHTHPYGHSSISGIPQQCLLCLEQLCLLAFGLSSTRLCLLTLAIKRGCRESVRRMRHGGLHPQSNTPYLCQREILQIPRTLTKLPRYAHTCPAGDVCAKDAVYQSLSWLCRQPTSISVCSIPNKTQK